MESTERITSRDTEATIVTKMAEGNPGAMRVCCELIRDGGAVDPDASLGGLHNLLGMDTLGIYGSRIWLLYKDASQESIPKVVAVLRGWQLGLLSEAVINEAIDYRGKIDFDSLIAEIRTKLPDFWQEEVTEDD